MTDSAIRAAGAPRKPVSKPRRKAKPHETLPGALKKRPLEKLHLARHHLHGGHHPVKESTK